MSVPAAPARKWNPLFLVLLLLEIALLVGMALCRRLPREHDGFGYFGLQYYFLNNAVTGGEIPQWIPYMTQGTVANWWYAIQGNLFLNAATLLGTGTLQSLNFLPLFYAGVAFDVLVLVVGVWLLARRFFSSSATVFFTAAAVAGPCIWMDQPWFNFHFLYAIPLMIALVHRFLDTGSWWYLLLAVNLLALQTIGNLPYCVPMTALVLCLYFILYGLFNLREMFNAVRRLRWGVPFAATVVLGAGGLAAAHLILQAGTEEIAYFNPGRGADARVQLDTFLSYGGEITVRKWAEIVLGISPSLDNTLYMGLLAVPLLIVGCSFGVRRRSAHLLVLAGMLVVFGLGGFVAAWAYDWWPLMGYYRHIGLTGGITRLFLCFVAGCGFEALFVARAGVVGWGLRGAAGLLAVGMVLLAGGLFYLSSRPTLAQQVLDFMHAHMATKLYANGPTAIPVIFDSPVLRSRLMLSGCVALLCAVLLAGRCFAAGWGRSPAFAVAALLLSTGDVYLYKGREAWLRTAALPRADLSLTAFQEIPYRSRRGTSFFAPNPRVAMLLRDVAFPGVQHWSTNPFAFVDEAGSSFRTDHWLRPLDRLLRTFAGQPITDATAPPPECGDFGPLQFPLQSAAARKLTGVEADKVQFFRTAHLLRDEQAIAALMADPRYRGDALFVTAPPGEEGEQPDPAHLMDNDRLPLDYTVLRFDSNHLEMVVNNPTDAIGWLFFSDVWHPGWQATVDGQRVHVHRAALAYKAVRVPPGRNRVHFTFLLRTVSVLHGLFAACSLLWLAFLAVLTARLCRSDPLPAPADPRNGRAPAGEKERSKDA
jgi:hypothetical protein